MKNKWWALILTVFMVLSILSGCNKSGGDQIIIGGLAPETGDVSVYGLAAKRGIELAIKEINDAGGVLGKKIKYVSIDEQGDSTQAVNAYRRLVDQEKIQALIGDVTSTPSMAVAQLAAKDNMPMITPTGTQEQITEAGKNVFRACYIDPAQGAAMGTFAGKELKAKTAAIIFDSDNNYSSGLKDAFVTAAKAAGVEIVATEAYKKGDKDFKSQLTKIAQSKPDILFVPDYYQNDAMIYDQAKQVGLESLVLGGDGWDGILEMLKDDGAKANGVYFANQFSMDDTRDKVQNFIKSFKEAYGEAPVSFSALGYDAAYIMVEAIKRAGGADDKDKLIKALTETDYEGVTGRIRFDEKRNPIKDIQIIRIENAEYKLFKVLKPEA